MKLGAVGRRVVLAVLVGGVPACWAAGLAAPAGAASGDCSQAGRTVTCTFTFTGSQQTLTVPAGVGSVEIDAVGAPGGGSAGGAGGTASATISVVPGQPLYVDVGGVGTAGPDYTGGFNGGGRADSNASVLGGAGGGGGASDVRTVSGSLSSRLVVAAGGGGSGAAGNNAALGHGGAADSSGTSGGANGSNGGGGGGGAGTSSAPGTGGAGGTAPSGTPGGAGIHGAAGVGGDGTGGPNNTTGGGGGGGYFGGGGGGGGGESGSTPAYAGGGGGGGGSCYALAPVACGAAQTATPSVTITYTLPDTTAPTISIASPGANATYPLGTAVPASFSCAEEAGGSGLAACQGPVAAGSLIDTSTPGPHSFTVTARDNAGNTSSQTVSYTVVGAPTATISSPATGGRYSLGQVVPTAFACSEASGGPGIVVCADSHGGQAAPGLSPSKSATGVLDTSHAGTHTYTVGAASADGLSGSTAITYTVVAPPSIEIHAPLANHTYDIGQAVPVKYTCTDGAGGPGIKSCSGTVKRGWLLNTQRPGTFKFTVTAKSRDGQKTTKTVTYSTAAPKGHAAVEIKLGGVTFTAGNVSFGPAHTDPVSALIQDCTATHSARCSSQRAAGSLTIQVAFPKSAPFKRSQHVDLFTGSHHGGGGTLSVYVRGPRNTTETFTWSMDGVVITGLQIAPAHAGAVPETVTFAYSAINYQGCRPTSVC